MNSETGGTLLLPGDPPPFEVVNPAGRARLVLFSDHAGRAIPQRLGTLGLSQRELDQHIGWDIGIGNLTRKLAAALDAPDDPCRRRHGAPFPQSSARIQRPRSML